MKTITLSDHTADKASAAAALREAEFVKANNNYRNSLALREANIKFLKHTAVVAWKNKEILSSLSAIIKLTFAYLSEKPRSPSKRLADKEEIVWASGSEGEQKVASFLSRKLSDDWILISGYRNSKGEIDQVLVGPRGICAIEIKYINGVVHCDGDRWWSDKYDRYGNLVESNKPLADKRGRGPSKQVNDSADILQSYLTKGFNVHRVYRAVVLSHDSSELGQINNITVNAVLTLNNFEPNRIFSNSPFNLDPQSVDRIVQAIRKDHDFHKKPRTRRYQTEPTQKRA